MQLNQQISFDTPRGNRVRILCSTFETYLGLKFTNAKGEEILDSIAVDTDYKDCLVTDEDNLNLAPSGFRRSEPLLSTTVTPDESQPE